MIRIAICDDEAQELSSLSSMMNEYRGGQSGEVAYNAFQSGLALLDGIKGGQYDIILLDIMMPQLSGMQAAHEIRGMDTNVKIIFLTSSPEFAVESYSVGAYYYLLKPVMKQTLFSLLDKAIFDMRRQETEKLVIKSKNGLFTIPFMRLEYVEVINKTVIFYIDDGSAREVNGRLSEFERELLARPEFIKTHRSFIVNMHHIQALGAGEVKTTALHTVPVSKAVYPRIKEAYMNYLFLEKGMER